VKYGIGWLPLGGYVKIAGMVDESMDTAQLKNLLNLGSSVQNRLGKD
jgi:membrane-associated protease RseP (regulator of RpoE activity)